MKKLGFILGFVLLLAAAPLLRADIVTGAPAKTSQGEPPRTNPPPQPPMTQVADDAAALVGIHAGLARPIPAAETSETSSQTVKQLPPAPSSLSLFLSAMGTLGAWQMTRLARRLHVGHLPAWYHEGAPDQIGHAFAIDLDFDAMPLCCFDQPGGQSPIRHLTRGESPVRLETQCPLYTSGPRAPPLCA